MFSVSQKKSDNEDIIESPTDLLPYMDKMTDNLRLLGAVLGVDKYASAVVHRPGKPKEQCIEILSHWIEVTSHPTWTLFCDRLERAEEFKNLRTKISRDQSLRHDL